MNESIQHLHAIAEKEHKLMIGLMSGTSLDGLDIALCEVQGTGLDTTLILREFKTVDYPAKVKKSLHEIVSVEDVSLQQLTIMHSWLGNYHADLITEALREWEIEPIDVDCIASHGQTVYHAPVSHHGQQSMPNATLQIVDGDHIARSTGIVTISDFRQKHTAAGGEGAPMVAVTDEMIYRHETESRLLLNIGGIANFTWLPKTGNSLTTDIGPGNTLIDQIMQQKFDQSFDNNGQIASSGSVHPELLKRLLDDAFFDQPMPRTTGPERFNAKWVRQKMEQAKVDSIPDDDLIATLTWLSAQTITDAIKKVSQENAPQVYVSGGGMHNTQLVKWIEQLLDKPVHSFEEIGFDPDAKEAVCFVVLANELLSGKAFSINPKQNTGRQVNFGKISLPV